MCGLLESDGTVFINPARFIKLLFPTSSKTLLESFNSQLNFLAFCFQLTCAWRVSSESCEQVLCALMYEVKSISKNYSSTTATAVSYTRRPVVPSIPTVPSVSCTCCTQCTGCTRCAPSLQTVPAVLHVLGLPSVLAVHSAVPPVPNVSVEPKFEPSCLVTRYFETWVQQTVMGVQNSGLPLS